MQRLRRLADKFREVAQIKPVRDSFKNPRTLIRLVNRFDILTRNMMMWRRSFQEECQYDPVYKGKKDWIKWAVMDWNGCPLQITLANINFGINSFKSRDPKEWIEITIAWHSMVTLDHCIGSSYIICHDFIFRFFFDPIKTLISGANDEIRYDREKPCKAFNQFARGLQKWSLDFNYLCPASGFVDANEKIQKVELRSNDIVNKITKLLWCDDSSWSRIRKCLICLLNKSE